MPVFKAQSSLSLADRVTAVHRNWPCRLAAATVILFGIFASTVAHACSLDGALSPQSFKPLHPESLRVAYAIRQAVTEATISGISTRQSPLEFYKVKFYKVSSYLERLRKLLIGADRNTEFYVLLVDYGLWSRFSPGADGMEMAVHVAKPEGAATVVVTGDTVVRAIVNHTMTIRQAQDRDLFVVSGPKEGRLSTSLIAATDR